MMLWLMLYFTRFGTLRRSDQTSKMELQNAVKHLSWSLLRKMLLTLNRELFLEKGLFQMFYRVLNTPCGFIFSYLSVY